jgi:hypothetical protein
MTLSPGFVSIFTKNNEKLNFPVRQKFATFNCSLQTFANIKLNWCCGHPVLTVVLLVGLQSSQAQHQNFMIKCSAPFKLKKYGIER